MSPSQSPLPSLLSFSFLANVNYTQKDVDDDGIDSATSTSTSATTAAAAFALVTRTSFRCRCAAAAVVIEVRLLLLLCFLLRCVLFFLAMQNAIFIVIHFWLLNWPFFMRFCVLLFSFFDILVIVCRTMNRLNGYSA